MIDHVHNLKSNLHRTNYVQISNSLPVLNRMKMMYQSEFGGISNFLEVLLCKNYVEDSTSLIEESEHGIQFQSLQIHFY